jgi:squalene cyclase
LQDRCHQARAKSLDFQQLILSMIALRSLGFADDGEELKACDARLQELVHIDEQSEQLSPKLATTPFSDALMSLLALRASGIASNHPSVRAAIRFLSQSRRSTSPRSLTDTANLLRLLDVAPLDDQGLDSALPPHIAVCGRYDDKRDAVARFSSRISPLTASLVDHLSKEQKRDGSWGSVESTADILEALAHTKCETTQPTLQRAVSHLRSTQQADGSWKDATGTSAVTTTSVSVSALIAANVATHDDAIIAGINWIVVHQLPSGGWDEQGNATHAAAALKALVVAGQPTHTAALRAVRTLIAAQVDCGGWEDNGLMSYDSENGRWFGNSLHSTALPLQELSRWAVAAASAQSATAASPSLRLVRTGD